jgi:hypothetical protein
VLLGTLVDENVAADGTSPDSVRWDSWRREDGKWTVVISPTDAEQPATFLFDAKSRYVLPADEFAHDLVGDVAIPESGDMAIADALREQAAAAEPLAEEPADDLVSEEVVAPEEAAERDHHAAVSSIKEARERRVLEQQQALADELEDDAATEAQRESEPADLEIPMEHDVAVPDTLPRKKKHERRRVPSWDEIMFGGRED